MTRIIAPLFILAALALAPAACGGDDDGEPDASTPDAQPARGTISMSWRLVSAGADAACSDVGGVYVLVEMVREGEAAGEADTFDCAVGAATTRQVNAGTYDIRLDLLDVQTDSLLPEQLRQTGIDVNEDGDTPIGEVVFELD
jgi:hypothetical protein